MGMVNRPSTPLDSLPVSADALKFPCVEPVFDQRRFNVSHLTPCPGLPRSMIGRHLGAFEHDVFDVRGPRDQCARRSHHIALGLALTETDPVPVGSSVTTEMLVT
jgi:hypothetical protein